MPHRDIKAVMEDHVDSLMAMPDVVGVAIGAMDDGTPCLLILVIDTTEAVKQTIPDTLEGYPVRVEVSGEIRPLDSD